MLLLSDYVQDKVREGETGNPSRSQPGLPGTSQEGALGFVRRDWYKYEFSADLIEILH